MVCFMVLSVAVELIVVMKTVTAIYAQHGSMKKWCQELGTRFWQGHSTQEQLLRKDIVRLHVEISHGTVWVFTLGAVAGLLVSQVNYLTAHEFWMTQAQVWTMLICVCALVVLVLVPHVLRGSTIDLIYLCFNIAALTFILPSHCAPASFHSSSLLMMILVRFPSIPFATRRSYVLIMNLAFLLHNLLRTQSEDFGYAGAYEASCQMRLVV